MFDTQFFIISYVRMYKDVRAAVDLCHRDGTLKQMVAKDPKRYKPIFYIPKFNN